MLLLLVCDYYNNRIFKLELAESIFDTKLNTSIKDYLKGL